ncbi:MAG: hypothetical protein ACE360_00535 [Hyphomicrobiales bacterium]
MSEIIRLAELGNPLLDPDDAEKLPRTIAIGNGAQLPINGRIDRAILAISTLTREQSPAITDRYNLKDWYSIVRQEFGLPIIKLDLGRSVTENAVMLRKAINEAIAEITVADPPMLEMFFPNTWPAGASDRFEFGPATVLCRELWLEEQFTNNRVSKTTKRRLEKLWRNESCRPRKPSLDAHSEQSIFGAVGEYQHLICIKLQGFSRGFAEARAARIARLLLTTISLTWETPSRALKGLHIAYDDLPQSSRLLWLAGENHFSSSSSRLAHPFGPNVVGTDWADVSSRFREAFEQASLVAEFIASVAPGSERAEVLKKLDVALRWFEEGCRARDHLMATTHFAASLDTLAGGGRKNGILALLKARLGWDREMTIHADGHKLSTVVGRIYEDGRSRFTHGNTEMHYGDWLSSRAFAEFISRQALLSCLFEANQNPELIDFRT